MGGWVGTEPRPSVGRGVVVGVTGVVAIVMGDVAVTTGIAAEVVVAVHPRARVRLWAESGVCGWG